MNNESNNYESMNNESLNNDSMNNESLNNDSMTNEYFPSPAELNVYNDVENMYNSNEVNTNEEFTNLSAFGINVDLVLKSIFFGAIFYLLSLPEVYKITSGIVGKKVDGVLLHALVYAVLYYILVHFI